MLKNLFLQDVVLYMTATDVREKNLFSTIFKQEAFLTLKIAQIHNGPQQ